MLHSRREKNQGTWEQAVCCKVNQGKLGQKGGELVAGPCKNYKALPIRGGGGGVMPLCSQGVSGLARPRCGKYSKAWRVGQKGMEKGGNPTSSIEREGKAITITWGD